MSETMESYWRWLTGSLAGETGLLWRLVERYGTPEGVFGTAEETLLKDFPQNPGGIGRLCEGRKKWDFGREGERLARLGISFVSCEHPAYPRRLQNIPQKPGGIYFRGELPKDDGPSVGIVGARACSAYGRSTALWFAGELAVAGVQIISGMASGIDGFGHWGALEAGGKTFGILGGGVDICYPKSHQELYLRLEQEGGLLSENPPGTKAMPHLFPLRNRIISGLSDAVLIIEAKGKSGSLITADTALEQGRDVYAVPGRLQDPLSAGCNRLIGQGAGIALSPESMLEGLGIISNSIKKKKERTKKDLEKAENMVYSCLGLQARKPEEICEETKLSLIEVLRILGSLELKGYAKEVYKNDYIRAL